jgi:hypothetical protein
VFEPEVSKPLDVGRTPCDPVSVCSWRTSERDVEQTLESFGRAYRQAD